MVASQLKSYAILISFSSFPSRIQMTADQSPAQSDQGSVMLSPSIVQTCFGREKLTSKKSMRLALNVERTRADERDDQWSNHPCQRPGVLTQKYQSRRFKIKLLPGCHRSASGGKTCGIVPEKIGISRIPIRDLTKDHSTFGRRAKSSKQARRCASSAMAAQRSYVF